MSSAAKTQHIKLNQWVGNEYPLRQDFVDDNKKIDDKFKEVDSQLGEKANANHAHTTVNGHTVESDVPASAKFTDTVYTHPTSHPASMITGLPSSLPANGGNADTTDGYHIIAQTTIPTTLANNVLCFVYE